MFKAIVWKEWREQWLIAMTLMVLGSGILVAAATLADPPAANAPPSDIVRFLGVGRLAALLLAVTSGMVCGGALFAAEREARTMVFLESLPTTRLRLWSAKVFAGAALACGQIAIVVAVAGLLGHLGTAGFSFAVVVYALLAFAWGTFGSTVSYTTLGSVGFAIPTATALAIVLLIPIMILFGQPGSGWPKLEGALLFLALMLAAPLLFSALLFTRVDRERAAEDQGEPVGLAGLTRTTKRSRLGIRSLLWLASKQLFFPLLVISAFALAFGFALLLPSLHPMLAWPILGLAAGVLAGVTTFADEQAAGASQFWGERRLPLGRMWTIKVATHALFALWLAFLILLPSMTRALAGPVMDGKRSYTFLSAVMRTLLFDSLGSQGWKFLLLPVAYGFVAGQLCGMLFRKTVVAAGVALLVGGSAAVFWFPSLLAGGTMHWQLWLPPLLTLLLSRFLIRGWATDRLGRRSSLITLASGLVLVALSESVGLAYRVWQVPDSPHGDSDLAFIAALPPFDANEAGRNFRTAAERYTQAVTAVNSRQPTIKDATRNNRVEERLDLAIHLHGWPGIQGHKPDPEMDAWLDAVFDLDAVVIDELTWFALATEAANRPTGIYEDPRNFSHSAGAVPFEQARRMALALLGRGLQQQAQHGDHATFAANYRIVMALVRNMRNATIISSAQTANGIERTALFAAYQWLRNLPGDAANRPQIEPLLIRLLAENLESNPRKAYDPMPHLLAERYIVRTLLAAPTQWLSEELNPAGQARDQVNAEADVVGMAWEVPWERERTRRLVGMVLDGDLAGPPFTWVRGRPGAAFLVIRETATIDLIEAARTIRVLRRGVTLSIAVRLYMLRKSAPPVNLDQLFVSDILGTEIPDPFGEQEFRYRVSTGETLAAAPGRYSTGRNETPPRVLLREGQPVIWSVGSDRIDQGGQQLPLIPGNFPRQDDLIFVVPLPPE